MASLLLGPKGSYSWNAPIALRKAREPWHASEVEEIVRRWPERWSKLASDIDIPVHLRIAEHEQIWETGQAVIARMRGRLVRSPAVDAAILPQGGHLYEIHKRGHELIASQLNFLLQWLREPR